MTTLVALCCVAWCALAGARSGWARARRAAGDVVPAAAGRWMLLSGLFVAVLFGAGGAWARLLLGLGCVGTAMFAHASFVWLHGRRAAMPFRPAAALLATSALGSLALPAGVPPVTLLVELGPDDRLEEIVRILEEHDAEAERAFPSVTLEQHEDLAQMHAVEVRRDRADALVEALRADVENVDFVDLDHEVAAVPVVAGERASAGGTLAANDPLLPRQWGFQFVRGPEALALLAGVEPRERAKVAIVDTKVESAHPDITGVFSGTARARAKQEHGTHCAGVAAAETNNALGVASLNWEGRFIELMAFEALPANGRGTDLHVGRAIVQAAQQGADVIGLSLGRWAPGGSRVQAKAVELAMKRGAIVVAAAGNAAGDARNQAPANAPGVLVVAAVDREGRRASFSNSSASLERPLAAPGVDILSLGLDESYVALSGTSMAAPMVSGLVGVLRALDPDLTAAQAHEMLTRTGTRGADAATVGATIDMEAAVREALGEPRS